MNGSLNFIRKPVQMAAQPVKQFPLGVIHRKIADQCGVSGVLP
jgi:hypothetical protein